MSDDSILHEADVREVIESEIVAESTHYTRLAAVTLVAGTVTVSNPGITAASLIRLVRKTPGGTVGSLNVTAKSTGSFTITSSSNTDTSVVVPEVDFDG